MKKTTFLLGMLLLICFCAFCAISGDVSQQLLDIPLPDNTQLNTNSRTNRDFTGDLKIIGASSYDHYPGGFNNWSMSYDENSGQTYIIFTDCNQSDNVDWDNASTFERGVSYNVIDEDGDPIFTSEVECESNYSGYPDLLISNNGRLFTAFHKLDGSYLSWIKGDRYNLGGSQVIFCDKQSPGFGNNWLWPQIRAASSSCIDNETFFVLSTDSQTKSKSKICKVSPLTDGNGWLSDPFFDFSDPVEVISENEYILHPTYGVSEDGNSIGIIYSMRGADTIAIKYVYSSDAGETWEGPITLSFDHSECDVTGNGQIDGRWTLHGLGAHFFFNSMNEPCVSFCKLVSRPDRVIHGGTSRIMFGKIDVEDRVLHTTRVSDIFEPVNDIAGACCGPSSWSLGAKVAYYNGGEYIFIAWIDCRDTIIRSCENAEIYYSYSTDWGATWSQDINVSNTQEDNDKDEVWLTVAPQVERNPETGTAILRMSFTWDESQGNSVIDEEFPGEITMNNMFYYEYDTGVDIPSLGVSDNYCKLERPSPGTFQNYPNPFNPNTIITFEILRNEPVTLKIFNIKGQNVKTFFADKVHNKGKYSVFWDGKNNTGDDIVSGVYFCKLQAGEYIESEKMLLLK